MSLLHILLSTHQPQFFLFSSPSDKGFLSFVQETVRYILNNALVHTPIQNVYVFLCSPPNQTSVLKTLNNAFVLGAEGVKEALHSIE